jgi:hypothetical protein
MQDLISKELQARINSYADALTEKMHRDWSHAQRIKFIPEVPTKGQKYIRIVQDEGNGRGGSVHSFISLVDGGVHKSASWKSPARDRNGKVYPAKYNLLDPGSFEALMFNLDTSGGYLYADYKIRAPKVDSGVSLLDSAKQMASFVPEMRESI